MASTGDPPAPEDLPQHIQTAQESLSASRSQLAESRLSLAQTIPQIHVLFRQIIQLSVRILEQTIHGSVASGTKAKADYLAVVAEGMSKKLAVQRAQLMQQVYTPDIQELLKSKSTDLDAQSSALKRKIRDAEEKLAEYQQAKGIGEMVKEYAELTAEIGKVQEEVERLEQGRR